MVTSSPGTCQLLAARLKEMPSVWGSCQVVVSAKGPALLSGNASSTTMCFAVSGIHSAGKNEVGWDAGLAQWLRGGYFLQVLCNCWDETFQEARGDRTASSIWRQVIFSDYLRVCWGGRRTRSYFLGSYKERDKEKVFLGMCITDTKSHRGLKLLIWMHLQWIQDASFLWLWLCRAVKV